MAAGSAEILPADFRATSPLSSPPLQPKKAQLDGRWRGAAADHPNPVCERGVLTRCVSVARSQWFSSACLVECQHLPPADKRRVTRSQRVSATPPPVQTCARPAALRGPSATRPPPRTRLHPGRATEAPGDFVTGRPPSPSSLRPCRCLCLLCRKGTGRRETAEAASPPSGPPLSFPATRCFSL